MELLYGNNFIKMVALIKPYFQFTALPLENDLLIFASALILLIHMFL